MLCAVHLVAEGPHLLPADRREELRGHHHRLVVTAEHLTLHRADLVEQVRKGRAVETDSSRIGVREGRDLAH